MEKPFKILAASDLHGDSRATKRLAQKAEEAHVDLVVLCGDLLGYVEAKGFMKPFADKKQKVLILPGNWDSFATTDFIAQLYGMKNIHGYSAVYKNIGFFGAGGTNTTFTSASERELKDTLAKAHAGLKGIEKKVMLTHHHPAGSLSEFSGISGSEAIREAIEQFKPDVLLHGHIHEAAGSDEMIGQTRVINVGKQGVIIEL